jgi:hypothetical protein
VHEVAPTRVSKYMFQTAQGGIVLGLQKHLSAHIGPTLLRRFQPTSCVGPVRRRRIKLTRETDDGHPGSAVEMMTFEILPHVMLTNEGVTFVS